MPDEQDIPLTALCAICHVNAIKYTCPRCSIHTCSLPCVKRHKHFAQCSGVRDPAAYRKRTELATPASIDRDFNFITKIERSLQRADDDAVDRGIHLAPAGLKKHGVPHRTKFGEEVQARGIRLIRAPEGLSRREQNKSAWKANNISWTIEWLAYTGNRRLQNFPEGRTPMDAFTACFGKKGLSRKRKRDENASPESKDQVEAATDAETMHPGNEGNEDDNTQQPTPQADATQEGLEEEKRSKKASHDLHFYLHRPQTSSNLKCLIPIDPNATWKEILKGRTLLEHPTVYIREEPPDRLPNPFILEQEYVVEHGEDVVVPPEASLDPRIEAESLPSTLDSGKILEVLKADLDS